MTLAAQIGPCTLRRLKGRDLLTTTVDDLFVAARQTQIVVLIYVTWQRPSGRGHPAAIYIHFYVSALPIDFRNKVYPIIECFLFLIILISRLYYKTLHQYCPFTKAGIAGL